MPYKTDLDSINWKLLAAELKALIEKKMRATSVIPDGKTITDVLKNNRILANVLVKLEVINNALALDISSDNAKKQHKQLAIIMLTLFDPNKDDEWNKIAGANLLPEIFTCDQLPAMRDGTTNTTDQDRRSLNPLMEAILAAYNAQSNTVDSQPYSSIFSDKTASKDDTKQRIEKMSNGLRSSILSYSAAAPILNNTPIQFEAQRLCILQAAKLIAADTASSEKLKRFALNLAFELEQLGSFFTENDSKNAAISEPELTFKKEQLLLLLSAALKFSEFHDYAALATWLTNDNLINDFYAVEEKKYDLADWNSADETMSPTRGANSVSQNISTAISVTSWVDLKNNAIAAVIEYQQTIEGGMEGKFRAARLLEALETLTAISNSITPGILETHQRRELILWLSAVVVYPVFQKKLGGLLIEKTGLDKKKLEALHISHRITAPRTWDNSSYELRAKHKLESNTNSSQEFFHAAYEKKPLSKIKAELIAAATNYLMRKNSDDGKNRVQNFKRALTCLRCDGTNDLDSKEALNELIFLLVQHSGAKHFKNEVLATIGFQEGYYNKYFHCKFSSYGLKEDHAKAIFDMPFRSLLPTVNWEKFKVGLKAAAAEYLNEEKHDELGTARAQHLLDELNKIDEQLSSNSITNKKAQQKWMILAFAAMFEFIPASNKLAGKIAHETGYDHEAFKALRFTVMGFSNIAVIKKAKELQNLTIVNDYNDLRLRVIKATEAYRNAGLGGEKGKFRAECFLSKLNDKRSTKNDLIYWIKVIVFGSSSKLLKTAILDYIADIAPHGLDEESLTNLQSKDSGKLNLRAGLKKLEEVDITLNRDVSFFKDKLLKAANAILKSCPKSEARRIAVILIEKLNVENLSEVYLRRLACAVCELNEDLKGEILACCLADMKTLKKDAWDARVVNASDIEQIKTEFSVFHSSPVDTQAIPTTTNRASEPRASASGATPWNLEQLQEFKNSIEKALNYYMSADIAGAEGKRRSQVAYQMLRMLQNTDLANLQEKLFSIARYLLQHGAAKRMFASQHLLDRILIHTGMSQFELENVLKIKLPERVLGHDTAAIEERESQQTQLLTMTDGIKCQTVKSEDDQDPLAQENQPTSNDEFQKLGFKDLPEINRFVKNIYTALDAYQINNMGGEDGKYRVAGIRYLLDQIFRKQAAASESMRDTQEPDPTRGTHQKRAAVALAQTGDELKSWDTLTLAEKKLFRKIITDCALRPDAPTLQENINQAIGLQGEKLKTIQDNFFATSEWKKGEVEESFKEIKMRESFQDALKKKETFIELQETIIAVAQRYFQRAPSQQDAKIKTRIANFIAALREIRANLDDNDIDLTESFYELTKITGLFLSYAETGIKEDILASIELRFRTYYEVKDYVVAINGIPLNLNKEEADYIFNDGVAYSKDIPDWQSWGEFETIKENLSAILADPVANFWVIEEEGLPLGFNFLAAINKIDMKTTAGKKEFITMMSAIVFHSNARRLSSCLLEQAGITIHQLKKLQYDFGVEARSDNGIKSGISNAAARKMFFELNQKTLVTDWAALKKGALAALNGYYGSGLADGSIAGVEMNAITESSLPLKMLSNLIKRLEAINVDGVMPYREKCKLIALIKAANALKDCPYLTNVLCDFLKLNKKGLHNLFESFDVGLSVNSLNVTVAFTGRELDGLVIAAQYVLQTAGNESQKSSADGFYKTLTELKNEPEASIRILKMMMLTRAALEYQYISRSLNTVLPFSIGELNMHCDTLRDKIYSSRGEGERVAFKNALEIFKKEIIRPYFTVDNDETLKTRIDRLFYWDVKDSFSRNSIPIEHSDVCRLQTEIGAISIARNPNATFSQASPQANPISGLVSDWAKSALSGIHDAIEFYLKEKGANTNDEGTRRAKILSKALNEIDLLKPEGEKQLAQLICAVVLHSPHKSTSGSQNLRARILTHAGLHVMQAAILQAHFKIWESCAAMSHVLIDTRKLNIETGKLNSMFFPTEPQAVQWVENKKIIIEIINAYLERQKSSDLKKETLSPNIRQAANLLDTVKKLNINMPEGQREFALVLFSLDIKSTLHKTIMANPVFSQLLPELLDSRFISSDEIKGKATYLLSQTEDTVKVLRERECELQVEQQPTPKT